MFLLLFIAIFGCFVGPCHNRLIDKLAVEKKLFLSNTTKPLLNEFLAHSRNQHAKT
jgi:hypothetical protein